MYNYLPRLCRSFFCQSLRFPLFVGAALVCVLLTFTQIARAFNGPDSNITAWQQYRWQIVGAVSLMLVETLLLAFLLISRARQRRAEAERERLARLAESEHRRLDKFLLNVPGVVWESRVSADGLMRQENFISQRVQKMLGYSVEEWMSEPRFWLKIMPEEEREETLRMNDAIFASGSDGVVQHHWKTRDGRLLYLGLLPAVKSLCHELSGRRGLQIEFIMSDDAVEFEHLDKELALCAYRVVQEALSNVIKHSGAVTARVQVRCRKHMLYLLVTDSGKGFKVDVAKHKGRLGLISMEERLRLANGKLIIRSRPNRGTQIEARIPLPN